MQYLVKFQIPKERGNEILRDPEFGKKMQRLITELKAESAYFTLVNGQRGGYFILDMQEASQLAVVAEPLFFWLNAEIECFPVMKMEDLQKAGPSIESAIHKWDIETILHQ